MGRDGTEHYKVLGVDPSASMDEIHRSYLRLARSSHPDLHTQHDGARLDAEARMREINAAWAVLGRVDERSAYDRIRLSGASRAPFHAATHGPVDEPSAWKPYDTGAGEDFDDRDDRPITGSALPSWMRTVPALGVLFGLAGLMVGALVGLNAMADVALVVLVLSGLMFLTAPLVALSISKGQDRMP